MHKCVLHAPEGGQEGGREKRVKSAIKPMAARGSVGGLPDSLQKYRNAGPGPGDVKSLEANPDLPLNFSRSNVAISLIKHITNLLNKRDCYVAT